MASKKTIVAFDLYGTLLSTESIAKELSTRFGSEKAADLAALWRRFQLEYTWRLNSMSIYYEVLFRRVSLCGLTLPTRTIPTFLDHYSQSTKPRLIRLTSFPCRRRHQKSAKSLRLPIDILRRDTNSAIVSCRSIHRCGGLLQWHL